MRERWQIICQTSKRIMFVQSLQSRHTIGLLQDSSREFIALLATVSAIGNVIPLSLLYASDSGDLQDLWLEDFDNESYCAYFGASRKGWTSDKLSLE